MKIDHTSGLTIQANSHVCSAACGRIWPKFCEIVGLVDGQKYTKFHYHRTMYIKMAAKILLATILLGTVVM